MLKKNESDVGSIRSANAITLLAAMVMMGVIGAVIVLIIDRPDEVNAVVVMAIALLICTVKVVVGLLLCASVGLVWVNKIVRLSWSATCAERAKAYLVAMLWGPLPLMLGVWLIQYNVKEFYDLCCSLTALF